jgi:hypothetical protein
MPLFEIGQEVWVASWGRTEYREVCPDCGGSKKAVITLFDGNSYDVACGNCSSGYNPPSGTIKLHQYAARVLLMTISGIRTGCGMGGVEYQLDYSGGSCWSYKDTDVFLNQEDAQVRAQEIALEKNTYDHDRFLQKEKQDRTWAWNVTYHRQEAKRALQSYRYHMEKLGLSQEAEAKFPSKVKK